MSVAGLQALNRARQSGVTNPSTLSALNRPGTPGSGLSFNPAAAAQVERARAAADSGKDSGGGGLFDFLPDLGITTAINEIGGGLTALVGTGYSLLTPGKDGPGAQEFAGNFAKAFAGSLRGTAATLISPITEPIEGVAKLAGADIELDDALLSPVDSVLESVGVEEEMLQGNFFEKANERGIIPALIEDVGNVAFGAGVAVRGASVASKLTKGAQAARFMEMAANPTLLALRNPYRTAASSARTRILAPAAETELARAADAGQAAARFTENAPEVGRPQDIRTWTDESGMSRSIPENNPYAALTDSIISDYDTTVADIIGTDKGTPVRTVEDIGRIPLIDSLPEGIRDSAIRVAARTERYLERRDVIRHARDASRIASSDRAEITRGPMAQVYAQAQRTLLEANPNMTRKEASRLIGGEVESHLSGFGAIIEELVARQDELPVDQRMTREQLGVAVTDALRTPDTGRQTRNLGYRTLDLDPEVRAAIDADIQKIIEAYTPFHDQVTDILLSSTRGDEGLEARNVDTAAMTRGQARKQRAAEKLVERARNLNNQAARERASIEKKIAAASDLIARDALRIKEQRTRIDGVVEEFEVARSQAPKRWRTEEDLAMSMAELHDLTRETGGVIYRPHTNDVFTAESTGHVVGVGSDVAHVVPLAEFTPGDIKAVVDAFQDLYDDPTVALHTVVDPAAGTVSIAPTQIVDDLDDALLYAASRLEDQITLPDGSHVATPFRPDVAAALVDKSTSYKRVAREVRGLSNLTPEEASDFLAILQSMAAHQLNSGVIDTIDDFFKNISFRQAKSRKSANAAIKELTKSWGKEVRVTEATAPKAGATARKLVGKAPEETRKFFKDREVTNITLENGSVFQPHDLTFRIKALHPDVPVNRIRSLLARYAKNVGTTDDLRKLGDDVARLLDEGHDFTWTPQQYTEYRKWAAPDTYIEYTPELLETLRANPQSTADYIALTQEINKIARLVADDLSFTDFSPRDVPYLIEALVKKEAIKRQEAALNLAKADKATGVPSTVESAIGPYINEVRASLRPVVDQLADDLMTEFAPGSPDARAVLRVFETADFAGLVRGTATLLRKLVPEDDVRLINELYTGSESLRSTWAEGVSRQFADDFIRYMAFEDAPANLRNAFERIRTALSDTWQPLSGSFLDQAPAEVRTRLDDWLNPSTASEPLSTEFPGIDLRVEEAGTMGQRAGRRPTHLTETPNDVYRVGRVSAQKVAEVRLREKRIKGFEARIKHNEKLISRLQETLEDGVKAEKTQQKYLERAKRMSDDIDARLDQPSMANAPRAWAPLYDAVNSLRDASTNSPELNAMLQELPDTLSGIQELARKYGFDPIHVREFTADQISNLNKSLIRARFNRDGVITEVKAGTRSTYTGASRRRGLVEDSLEAFAAAASEAIGERLTNEVVQQVEKVAARRWRLEYGEIPKGWVAWDNVRSTLLEGTFLNEDTGRLASELIPDAGLIVPEDVIKGLKRELHTPDSGILKHADKLTNAWRTFVLVLSPGWYARNLVGNTIAAVVEGGFNMEAWRQAWASFKNSDEFARFANTPFVSGDTLVGDSGQFHDNTALLPRSTNLRASTREAINEAAFTGGTWLRGGEGQSKLGAVISNVSEKMMRANTVVDELSRAYVYNTKIGKGMSRDEAWAQTARALVDYSDLGPLERSWVRSVIPFYSWQKGILKTMTGHIIDKPAAAAISAQLGRMQEEYVADLLGVEPGQVPDYYTGIIGDGVMNFQSFNPFADAASLTSPGGIGRSLNPFAEALIRNSLGAPKFFYGSDKKMDEFGNLVGDVDLASEFTSAYFDSPFGRTLLEHKSPRTALGFGRPDIEGIRQRVERGETYLRNP